MPIPTNVTLKICNGCGEIYDASIEAEAVHHEQAAHCCLNAGNRAAKVASP